MTISPGTLRILVGVLIGVAIATPITYLTTNGGHKSALKSVQPSLTQPTTQTTNNNDTDIDIKKSDGIVLKPNTEQTAATIRCEVGKDSVVAHIRELKRSARKAREK